MDTAELKRDALGNHPLLAAGMDEQQIFLPVLEEPEVAAGIALLGRHVKPARRRHPARHRGRDIGLDAIKGVDGDALALAQAMHQLAVIDGAAAKGRFRHIGLAAEFGDLAQDLIVFHQAGVFGTSSGQRRVVRMSYHHLPTEGNPLMVRRPSRRIASRVCLRARCKSNESRHTRPPGLACVEPDDRLQRGYPVHRGFSVL